MPETPNVSKRLRRWLAGIFLKWGLHLWDPKWKAKRMKDETNYQLIALPRRLTDSEYEYVVDWVRSRRPGEFV